MIKNPFRYFKTSPEIIQLAVMMYVRFPLSLRNVEDLLHERGVDICHESVRLWVDRFGMLLDLGDREVGLAISFWDGLSLGPKSLLWGEFETLG